MTALLAPFSSSPQRMSVADFRVFQDARPTEKWQLVDGRIYAMAGGTMRHARIARNLAFALHRRLQGGPCEVFIADANVVDEQTDFSSYPDVVVRCGATLDLEREMNDPTACFEVLSPSTRHLDGGAKLFAYQQLPSLAHVALIFADEMRVEVWSRSGEVFDSQALKRGQELLELAALGVAIPLAEIYEGVEVENL